MKKFGSFNLFFLLLLAFLFFVVPKILPYIADAFLSPPQKANAVRATKSKQAAIAERLLLVGDAGNMNSAVIEAVSSYLREVPGHSSILYLGDNVYPHGIASPEDVEKYNKSKKRLLLQIDPFKNLTKQIYFIPGNHDWHWHHEEGWDAVKREDILVSEILGKDHFAPHGGCPGPNTIHISDKVKIIALDSQWWLHTGKKPSNENDGCENYTEDMVVQSLEKALKAMPPDAFVLITLHHPLESYGMHGLGNDCPADMGCPDYQDMRQKLFSVLDKYSPALCVSGHDHGLQVLNSGHGCKLYLVSGGGSDVQPLDVGKNTLYSSKGLGFMVLDKTSDDEWELSSVEVNDSKILNPASWQIGYFSKL